jgi:hypothetical protein
MTTSLKPDLRKRRVSAAELRQDAAEEAAEFWLPTLRAYRDARGWVLIIDGVPFRARSAFTDDHETYTWQSHLIHSY